jgi:hypothetical protein
MMLGTALRGVRWNLLLRWQRGGSTAAARKACATYGSTVKGGGAPFSWAREVVSPSEAPTRTRLWDPRPTLRCLAKVMRELASRAGQWHRAGEQPEAWGSQSAQSIPSVEQHLALVVLAYSSRATGKYGEATPSDAWRLGHSRCAFDYYLNPQVISDLEYDLSHCFQDGPSYPAVLGDHTSYT